MCGAHGVSDSAQLRAPLLIEVLCSLVPMRKRGSQKRKPMPFLKSWDLQHRVTLAVIAGRCTACFGVSLSSVVVRKVGCMLTHAVTCTVAIPDRECLTTSFLAFDFMTSLPPCMGCLHALVVYSIFEHTGGTLAQEAPRHAA